MCGTESVVRCLSVRTRRAVCLMVAVRTVIADGFYHTDLTDTPGV
jgi:hypothetical protein